MKAARASMDFSTWTHKRIAALFNKGQAVSENELQEALSHAQRDEQLYEQARAAHQLTVRGPRPEQIAQAQARMLIQQELVNVFEDRIKRHTILSPFDGHVTVEHTEVGQWVREGDPIVEVVQLSQVDVLVHVLARDVGQLKLGTPVRVEVPALSSELLTGTVAVVVPQADEQARTFPVKVRLANQLVDSAPVLKAGMLARVALPTGREEIMTLVPKDAIVLGGETPLVIVADPQEGKKTAGTARLVPVTLGISTGDLIQVTGSLRGGQLVVIRGNERLRPGQPLTFRQLPGRSEKNP
ncbi:MAG: efflux RND transporter periplasmic adaptor subunit, partial [Pirellulaceae bacterium]|nr:efflux RND transporter periplasmic adaptor subunit [Pirellulaceae bacterium]